MPRWGILLGRHMYGTLQIINIIIVIISGICALLVAFSRPVRNMLFKSKAVKEQEKAELNDRRETDKCLLRDRIVSTYYKNRAACEIRQFEFENVSKLYNQYIKLGGNSFVCKIFSEMQDWTIVH